MDKINALEALFSNPEDLWAKILENSLSKGFNMIGNFQTAVAQYNAGQFEDFGKTLAGSITWFFDIWMNLKSLVCLIFNKLNWNIYDNA